MRDIREADVRKVVESGLEEHMQLEYKSELYGNNDAGKREFLLDICRFANANGGLLLIGIPERRDEQAQPTGAPDPDGTTGLEIPNPEAVLASYDARVMEAIEERLPLESAAIDVGRGLRVLAIRVVNSTRKPHSVRHQGHIYFPSRRERQRYNMNVREIKDLVMRTSSHLQHAEEILGRCLTMPVCGEPPHFIVGILPVFFDDYIVNLTDATIRKAIEEFDEGYLPPTYSFEGLERYTPQRHHEKVTLGHNCLLKRSQRLPLSQEHMEAGNHLVGVVAFDLILRKFVTRARTLFEAAGIGPPYVMGMPLRTQKQLVGVYSHGEPFQYHTDPVAAGNYLFPYMQVDDMSDVDRVIRPLCDHLHQTFGLDKSNSFDTEGHWTKK